MKLQAAKRDTATTRQATPMPPASLMTAPMTPVGMSPRGACACGGGCPRCRAHTESAAADRAPPIVHEVLRAPGAPLPRSVRADMQQRFGQDLGDVRVHTDSLAARAAHAVNAHAYTVGSHVAFGAGRYAPHTAVGRRTLAHELTHVLQQRGAAPSASLKIGRAGDAAEHEANRLANQIQAGTSVAPVQVRQRSSLQTLRRQDDGRPEMQPAAEAAIANGRMVPVSGVNGEYFYTPDCFDVPGCWAGFRFERAYVGHFTHMSAGYLGAYVMISTAATPECGDCSTFEVIQVVRDIRRDAEGSVEAAEPSDPELPPDITMTPELERRYRVRHRRSGWPHGPARGWRVDVPLAAVDPFYTHTSSGHSGTPGGRAAGIGDLPWYYDYQRNVGRQFQTCLICVDPNGVRSPLACLRWGFYVDSNGNISFEPAIPVATCGTSPQLRTAAQRWDVIEGNERTGLTWHTPRRTRRSRAAE